MPYGMLTDMNRTLTYRPTLSSAPGLYIVGISLALLLAAAGALSRTANSGLIIAAGALLACLLAIRIRYRVCVSEQFLESHSLFGQSRVRWRDIVRVRPAAQGGYWKGRLLGPYVLDFESAAGSVRVNMKLYSTECFREVMRRVPPGAAT